MKIVKLGTASARKSIAEMRQKLSFGTAVVTQDSRRKTMQVFGEDLSPIESVRRIVSDVRREGDEAVFRYTKLLDGFELTGKNFRVSPDEIAAAGREVSKGFLKAAQKAIERVRRFQERILEKDPPELSDGGRRLSVKLLPVRRVGVHVPGFSAVLPSSVIMTCVPAQVAGVKEIALCSPPNASGKVCAETLACCGMLGVEEVYRMGGAQAIAALALGTASVAKVDMVAGPGNLFTTLAKKEVFGEAAIDLLAGPSEVLVLADDSAQADVVAADLLAQAEHAPAAAFLVTPSAALARAVAAEVEKQLQGLSRRDRAAAVMEEYSLAIVTTTMEEAVELANDLAPEHLEIVTTQDDAMLSKIRSAGTVFVGGWTPTAAGDYIAGPSHTLPTGGTAKFASGLSANSFLRRMSIVRYDRTSLEKDREDIVTLAETEGLTAHAQSVRIRFRKGEAGDAK